MKRDNVSEKLQVESTLFLAKIATQMAIKSIGFSLVILTFSAQCLTDLNRYCFEDTVLLHFLSSFFIHCGLVATCSWQMFYCGL